MRKRQKHIAVADPILPNSILHHCLAAGVAMLVTEAYEDTVGGVLLLGRCPAVVFKNLPDHWQERLQLRLRPLVRLPIARRLVVGQHLLQRAPADPVLRDRSALAQNAGQYLKSYLAPDLPASAGLTAWSTMKRPSWPRPGSRPPTSRLQPNESPRTSRPSNHGGTWWRSPTTSLRSARPTPRSGSES